MARNTLPHPPVLRLNIFSPNSCIFSMSGAGDMENGCLSTMVPPCHSFLPTLLLCSWVGLVHGLQPFRINLLQHGTYVDISSFKENLLQWELFAREHFFNKYPACSGVVISRGFRELPPLSWSFLPMGSSLFHVWSTSFLFFSDLRISSVLSHIFSLSELCLYRSATCSTGELSCVLQWVHCRAALTASCWLHPCSHSQSQNLVTNTRCNKMERKSIRDKNQVHKDRNLFCFLFWFVVFLTVVNFFISSSIRSTTMKLICDYHFSKHFNRALLWKTNWRYCGEVIEWFFWSLKSTYREIKLVFLNFWKKEGGKEQYGWMSFCYVYSVESAFLTLRMYFAFSPIIFE